jgi:TolB-like protein/Tfp pilus assembly protein PilF
VQRFFAEIRRRKVLQTFLPYLGFVWLVLQVVSVITEMLRLSPLVDTFTAALLFAGMPVMLYLSWYFDFSSSGLTRTPDSESGAIEPLGVGAWGLFALIMAGSLYSAYVFYTGTEARIVREGGGQEQRGEVESIAVLPFTDLSPKEKQAYLASGLAEEISHLLGSFSELQVASASSARSLFEKGLDPLAIAQRLDVQTVVTGTVRKEDNSLRVFVELIDAPTSKVLWSETFSRSFDDVFLIEAEIARSASNRLIDRFVAPDRFDNPLATSDADAYVLYLKGRQAYNRQTSDGIREARGYFEQAISIDPEYSQAYVALADTIALSADGSRNFGILQPDIARMLANEHLARALVRNPELAEAYAVQGRVLDLGGQRDEALSAYDKAIALNPSLAKAHMWRYLLLRDLGRERDAFETLQTARTLDPESITLRYNYGIELDRRGRFREAMAVFEDLIEAHRDLPMGYVGMAGSYFSLGDLSASIDYWRRAYALSPDNDDYLHAYLSIMLNLGLSESVRAGTADPAYLPALLYSEKRHEALREELRLRVAAYPDDPWTAFEAAWYFMLLDEDREAAELLVITDGLMDPEQKYAMPTCSPAVEIAWSHLQRDQGEAAEAILATCRRRLARLDSSGIRRHEQEYLRIRLDALADDRSAAAALLRLVEAGYLESWIAEDPLLTNLRGQPEFLNASAKLQARLRAEKAQTLALLGDAPAPPETDGGAKAGDE